MATKRPKCKENVGLEHKGVQNIRKMYVWRGRGAQNARKMKVWSGRGAQNARKM